MKICKDCNKELVLENFYKYGLYYSSYCKSCHYKRSYKTRKEMRKDFPEKFVEYRKKWYENKKEDHYKTCRTWVKDNGLQLKSKRIWNGTNTEYNLDDFLNDKGIVYFIGDTNGIYVKIGITSSIFSLSHRFRTIQGCNPMPLKLLGFIQDEHNEKLERRLHEQFKPYNRIGEWHILAPEINRYIKENCMHIELANTMIGETYLSLPSILADDLGY